MRLALPYGIHQNLTAYLEIFIVLKQIETTDLQLGMYIAKIGDKWFDSPFWRSAFLLSSEQDIHKLLEHGFSNVWIDTSKGNDVETISTNALVSSDKELENRPAIQVDAVTLSATLAPAIPHETTSRAESFGFGDPLPIALDEPRPAPLDIERARAAAVCGKARKAMVAMFQEVRMGSAVDAQSMLPVVDEISQSMLRNSDALIGLVRLKTKNDYTYMHSVAVCALMVALARQLGMTESAVKEAGLAGLLHDVGKMAIPSGILDKPGSLNDEEFRVVKLHPVSGHRILTEGNGVPDSALDVVLHHHERMDGSGYPEGLANEQIRFCRIKREGPGRPVDCFL